MILLLAVLCLPPLQAQASGPQGEPSPTSFSYQGQIKEDGQPANGAFDIALALYDSSRGGTLLAEDQHLDVPVVDGLFTVFVDFGTAPFAGRTRWLETRLARAGAGDFSTLEPRQAVVATPQSIFSLRAEVADDAGRLGGLEADAFLQRSGGTIFGDLAVTGQLEAGGIDIEDGDLEVDLEHGIRSEGGARLITGPVGQTFQLYPGSANAHIAIFRDFSATQRVSIDKDGQVGIGTFTPNEMLSVTGNIEVGGVCFRPRQLVRCFIASLTNHLTWVENGQECLAGGGQVEGQPFWILGQC